MEEMENKAAETAAENVDVDTGKADLTQTYTKSEVDKLLSEKISELQNQKKKEADEVKNLSQMSEQEKVEFERDKFKAELENLKKANTLNEMSKTVRNILSEQNINIPDNLLSQLVNEDAKATKSNVDCFAKFFKDTVEKAVKEELRSPTPRMGKTPSKMTKEDITAIKDVVKRQAAIKENISLFE